MKKQKEYYLGLDIGTDSVGYAVTDEKYNLLKFKGESAWGVQVFDAASLSDERRMHRTSRRRLDRRQQRVNFVKELLAPEITKVDQDFYKRIEESRLFREDTSESYILFTDEYYNDSDYFRNFPTIHHLICELMESDDIHDVRLVYLALSWLVAHRGHFLSNINADNIAEVKDFRKVYDDVMAYFTSNGYDQPWKNIDIKAFEHVLRTKNGITVKNKELIKVLYAEIKPSKIGTEEFPFSQEAIVKLIAGGTVKASDLFCKEEYTDIPSFSLGDDDDKFGQIMSSLGEDYDLIEALRKLYDWAVLADVLGDFNSISEAKVAIYNQHKADLKSLKYFIRTYKNDKYDEVFRNSDKDNYVSYVKHQNSEEKTTIKKKNKELFSKYIIGIVKEIEPIKKDKAAYEDMLSRLELRTFLPKQKETNNRVIPHQLYGYEYNLIVDNASKYLPYLNEKDEKGMTVAEKLKSVFFFRIPYFVGPLNANSNFAWLSRKNGRITPWNFAEMVDLDQSEQNFIARMINTCSYLPGQPVLPKDSLIYHRFMVLNEINNLRINGEKISVELKQNIYNDCFMKKKKITKKYLINYLISNGIINKDDANLVTGVDDTLTSNLVPQIAFRELMTAELLTEDDVESIIYHAAFSEDKLRYEKWLNKNYPNLSDENIKYISSIKIKDFGRLSKMLLAELEGADVKTGEVFTVMSALWNTQNNLMELLSDHFTFKKSIEDYSNEYYAEHPAKLEDRLEEMSISNAVKRPIYRTLDIVKDVTKAFGEPSKIFVEVTRGSDPAQKGKRTKSRKQQLLDLYAACKDEDCRLLQQQLEAMGDAAENKLQGDKLFLYYVQLGKCMYTGEPIRLEELASKSYDIDHIYPQAYVDDDSIINNRVLVLSTVNGEKSDTYPLDASIRNKMHPFWEKLLKNGLISEEKYRRLTRNKPFSDDEKQGFINRQLTETSQSTKAVATLLKERFPNAEIVYSKANVASEFRHTFDRVKSRLYNDLHHATDAYLNIVTGNVYQMKFDKRWFNVQNKYSIKVKTIFTHPLICNGQTVWDGEAMLEKVKQTLTKNTAHFNKFAYFKKGGLFDQMPVAASEGLTPLKEGLDTSKYGGYNKAGTMFFIPIKYFAGKKTEVFIMPVEVLYGEKFLQDQNFACSYSFARLEKILGKKIDKIEFPMGMRPWKVNTILSLDGFRVAIAGSSSGGKTLIAQPNMQFLSDYSVQMYVKKLERFVEKNNINNKYIYDSEYDKISCEENMQLYCLYIEKYETSIYSKRVNSPIDTLKKGKVIFEKKSVLEQAKALLNIHQTFGRIAGGCDLSVIGGVARAAATISFSAAVSNWKKNYKDVHIIDVSPSGLWKKHSEVNLLDLV